MRRTKETITLESHTKEKTIKVETLTRFTRFKFHFLASLRCKWGMGAILQNVPLPPRNLKPHSTKNRDGFKAPGLIPGSQRKRKRERERAKKVYQVNLSLSCLVILIKGKESKKRG